MQRIPRDPMKFDVADLIARYGQQQQVSLQAGDIADRFIDQVRDAAQNVLNSPSLLHGQRTQAMFEAMVVALGGARLIKQEDAGDIYGPNEDLQPPDFRLFLEDGSQLLVEVKNHHAADPVRPFELRSADLDGLVRYADLVGTELRIAVYWARWNLWTLVPPSVFVARDNKRILHMRAAGMGNEMVRLGDMHVGTKFPLRIRFVADKAKPRAVGPDGVVRFTIGGVEIYCAGQGLTDPVDQNIAWHLMVFGRWQDEEDLNEVEISGDELEAVQFGVVPPVDQGQGFEIVGSLSEIFSSSYGWRTLEAGDVAHVRADVTPGSLGRLIPEDHCSGALPLWMFHVQPSNPLR